MTVWDDLMADIYHTFPFLCPFPPIPSLFWLVQFGA